MESPQTTPDNSVHSPVLQIGLWLFGQGCWIMSLVVQDMTISQWGEFFYKWFFWALSLLSLLFIVAINRKKGMKSLKEWWADIKKFFKKS